MYDGGDEQEDESVVETLNWLNMYDIFFSSQTN